MSESSSRLLVHFGIDSVGVYCLQGRMLNRLCHQSIDFGQSPSVEELIEIMGKFISTLSKYTNQVDNESVRLYATGVCQRLSPCDQARLINGIFIDHGLNLNIISPDLEQFYLKQADGVMQGLLRQELRQVVVCGSFQQALPYIKGVIDHLKRQNIQILSPQSTRVRPETLGTDFILFDYQEDLKNERDTWRYKYEHMEKFKQADAIVVCNPGGSVGKGTMFEFGFMVAFSKRIIFTEKPTNLSILFPYEVGLNF